VPDDPKPAEPSTSELPEAQPPDSVQGVSIDLGPAPAPVDLAPKPTPPSRRPVPKLPPRTGTFDPRLVVPLDLLDPSLPSSKEVTELQRQARGRRLRIGILIGGGVLTGLLAGVVAMLILRQKGPEPLSPELDVSFEVQSEPAGAEIFVDGKSTGLLTPAQLKGWDFTSDHQVSVELKGYYPERRAVAIGLHPPDLNLQLPQLAHLAASTQPIPAAVLLNGEVVATTPADIDLPAGRDLKLVLRAAGYVPLRRDVRLKPDESMRLDATLEPLAIITVKSTPPGAKVSVDGAPSVLAPAELEVTAGKPHRIESRVPGLAAQVRTVSVPAGKTQHVDLNFEDPRDRRARTELARLHAREAVDRRKLRRTEARGGDEYVGNAHRLNEENSISDDLERIEAREQDLEDEIADHDQELEDRIKTENIEATPKHPPAKRIEPAAQ